MGAEQARLEEQVREEGGGGSRNKNLIFPTAAQLDPVGTRRIAQACAR